MYALQNCMRVRQRPVARLSRDQTGVSGRQPGSTDETSVRTFTWPLLAHFSFSRASLNDLKESQRSARLYALGEHAPRSVGCTSAEARTHAPDSGGSLPHTLPSPVPLQYDHSLTCLICACVTTWLCLW